MPNLNELTLDELAALGAQIATLVTAGKSLEAGRLGPVFDLTPGAPITIYTNAVMPAMDEGVPVMVAPPLPSLRELMKNRRHEKVTISGPEPVIDCAGITTAEVADRIADRAFERDVGVDTDIPSFLKRESTEAPPTSPASEPVDPPPALGELPAADPVSAATDAKPQPEPWSAAEDSTLIHTVVDLMVNRGMARKPAATEASKLLPGRTADACVYRAHTKAKQAINAAVAEAAVRQAQTEAPEIPATETEGKAVVSEDAAAGGHSPAAVQSEPQNETVSGAADPVTAHLMALPEGGGWTLDRDATLMELSIAGWQPNEIALEVGMRADQIKARFDALTGLYLDANRKPVRRFAREDVMAGLTRLSAAA